MNLSGTAAAACRKTSSNAFERRNRVKPLLTGIKLSKFPDFGRGRAVSSPNFHIIGIKARPHWC